MLTILVGLSGSGKTTIADKLIQEFGYRKLITCTTRKPRLGEREGVDYHFLSTKKFAEMRMNGEFIESTEYAGNSYGTRKADVEDALSSGDNVVMILDDNGARFMHEAYSDKVAVFYIVRNKSDLVAAVSERDIPSEEKAMRINMANGNTDIPSFYRVIKNDKVEAAAYEIKKI